MKTYNQSLLLPKAVCNETMKLEERQVGEDTAGQLLRRSQISVQAQIYKVVAEYGLVENIRARGQSNNHHNETVRFLNRLRG